MKHYIHRPTPEGGETDPRFRELTSEIFQQGIVEYHRPRGWVVLPEYDWIIIGTIWRIIGSDAPSDELRALARAEKTRDWI